MFTTIMIQFKMKVFLDKFMVCVLLMLLAAATTNAQVTDPSRPEYVADYAWPQNTGITSTTTSALYTICVWDGVVPSFHIDVDEGAFTCTVPLAGNGFIPGELAEDPDIVNFPGSVKWVIVYGLAGHIFAEVWQHEGGCDNVLIDGPTMISDGTPNCLRPNVDQLENGAAFVWEQDGVIKGRYWTLLGTLSSPELGAPVNISPCSGLRCTRPDVSVYREGGNDIANVVFVGETTAGPALLLQRIDLDAFYAAGPVDCSQLSTLLSPAGPLTQLGEPRIASPPIGGGHYLDCEVVVDLYDSPADTYTIIGINRHEATSPGLYIPTQLNVGSPVTINSCINSRPVVTYSNCGKIIVEWEYLDCDAILGLPGGIILGRALLPWGATAWPTYSRVNNSTGFMITAAVAARYRVIGNKVASLYNDAAIGTMIYKWSPCNSPSMKSSSTELLAASPETFVAFPNPFSSAVQLQLPVSQSSGTVAITNAQGQVVRKWINVPAGTQQLSWEAGGIASGIYFVRFSTQEGVHTQTIQKTN